MAAPNVAVVDTDVFSALYIDPAGAQRRGNPVAAWRHTLTGRRVLISFQTRAEIRAGVLSTNWGPPRVDSVLARLNQAHTIPADEQVIETFASLTADCKKVGHALHAKIHTADRWVAACAIAKALPLLSGDRIYKNAPGLTLL